MVDITSVSKTRQIGHWRSMYSTIVTGALAEPSTFPCCGIPLKSCTAVPASGSVVTGPVEDGDEDPPVSANASAAATAASAIAPAPAASTFGEARRPPPPVLRTGGGAGVRRWPRAFLPL